MVALVIIISAIETRLRSPPEIPRTKGFPTIVFIVCSILNIFSNSFTTLSLNSWFDIPEGRFPGVLVSSAKPRVWPTKIHSSPSSLYTASPRYLLAKVSAENFP
ncbi:unnamed protein product [Tuber aestivum]|uniref:Uncharacterized protein n=1 Tax=Tuber aestivum TaxID=59557 RepID=A0A292PMC6_9PEZI|nr:unnamed protein product [Tuber aestivum]